MCGIAGFAVQNGAARESLIQSMCDAIEHRGPDDEGIYVDGPAAIGMRRLSIIDLSTGHQPIPNEDQTIWIVFNGEVYNYQSLREELIAKGHRFRTNSDTETILHLYEQEGPEGVKRLRGMFAYAIWDTTKRQLYIARDRFGKKPLYYAHTKNGLCFASELKSLRVHDLDWTINNDALKLYFQFKYIPEPYTPFKAVQKLPAAHWMRYDMASGKLEQQRYWKLPAPSESDPASFEEAKLLEEMRQRFDEAVRIRMIADVPLGAFLSGGLDSSSVVASMAMQSKNPVKTFSIGFEIPEYNELPAAKLVAEKYGTEHHEIIVHPDSVNLIEKLVRHFDEPFGDSSALPTYAVSEFARRYVKVALSGDGGDELFAGYDSFVEIEKFRRFDALPQPLRALMRATADLLPYSSYGKNYLRVVAQANPLSRYFEQNLVPYYVRERLVKPDWMLPADTGFLQKGFADQLLGPGADIFSQALYFEAHAKLTGDFLVKVDRMSMAASLEVRCPLLDHELAEWAMSIPKQFKLRNGRTKYLLVRALQDRLPPKLLTLPKKGFGAPLTVWFRTSLRQFLHDHLTSKEFLGRGMISESFLKTLLAEHDSGRRDHYHLLWSLLMLELWFRDWKEPKRIPPRAAVLAGTDA
jgi:asparagine synthase (glutamine-hydrolysing)